MKTRAKPLMFGIALALGASAPAFAWTSPVDRSADNTNSIIAPSVMDAPAAPMATVTGVPVTSGTVYSSTTVVIPAPALSDDAQERAARAARVDSDEEHGGLRNRIRNEAHGLTGHVDDDDAAVAVAPGSAVVVTPGSTTVVTPAPDTTVMPADEDARERAARAARSSDEEEHGGVRNWVRDKKDRAREKLGLGHDDD